MPAARQWRLRESMYVCVRDMLHHGWLVASSIAIAAQCAQVRKGPLGFLVCTSGLCSAAYWVRPVPTCHFECRRFVVDFVACCVMCVFIVTHGLVVSPACRGWTIAAAVWCATSWTLGFLEGGSSPTQRLAHLAMHASAVRAIATLARGETWWGVSPLA